MKRHFKISVLKEMVVTIDDEKMDDQFINDFKKVFYNYDDIRDHAEHIALNHESGAFEYFMEGYGNVKGAFDTYTNEFFKITEDSDFYIYESEEIKGEEK